MASASPLPTPGYPATRESEHESVLHGVIVKDPYRWLEDGAANAVLYWNREQDAFARERRDKLPARGAIAARLGELFYIDAISAPQRRGDRYFYARHLADQEKSIVCWKRGEGGAEQVLLDPNAW